MAREMYSTCDEKQAYHRSKRLKGALVMSKKEKKLTCTFFVGGKQVDELSPEHLDKMAQRLGETMSIYYSQHPDEYKQLKLTTLARWQCGGTT